MMQKNLTCKSLTEAKWNMLSFSFVLFFVNVVFVSLGGLLFLYLDNNPEIMTEWTRLGSETDELFPVIALSGNLGSAIGVFFVIGLVAAAYSSADSALTSLTTSFNMDILKLDKRNWNKKKVRLYVHIGMSLLLLLTIIIFSKMKEEAVIWELFKAANFTYGPLLGLFLFGIFSKRSVLDIIPLLVCLVVVIAMFLLNKYSSELFYGYQFGSELLGINAGLIMLILWMFSKPQQINEIK